VFMVCIQGSSAPVSARLHKFHRVGKSMAQTLGGVNANPTAGGVWE
jgi:hypothetical protein